MNTLFIGRPIIELDSVESTNTYAIELIKEQNVPEGMVIFAHKQTKGRGQRDSSWASEPLANLTFSIILKPSFVDITRQFIITQIISLATADYLTHLLKDYLEHDKICTSPPSPLRRRGSNVADSEQSEYLFHKPFSEIKIKWPNDLYVGGNKIAGILIENSIRENKIINTIVGIGLNVNQMDFDKNIPNPTSLKRINGKNYNIKKCLEELCSFIEARYLLLKSGKTNQIDSDYKKALYRLNEWGSFLENGKEFTGKIIGTTAQGLLIIEQQNGKRINYAFKEVSMLLK